MPLSKEEARAELAWRKLFFDLSDKEKTNKTTLALTDAAWNGNLEIVKLYLAAGVDINARNTECGNTPLYAAAENGQWDVAQFLLDNGAGPNIANNRGRTPLLSAVEQGIDKKSESCDPRAKRLIQSLLDKNANINAKDSKTGATPLFAAIEGGDADVIKVFLSKGANVNAKNDDGDTLLFRAVSKQNQEVIKLLLDQGSDINAKDVNGETVLMKAVQQNDIELVRLLLSRGAGIKVKTIKTKISFHNREVKRQNF